MNTEAIRRKFKIYAVLNGLDLTFDTESGRFEDGACYYESDTQSEWQGAKWGYQQAVKDMEAETKADVIEEAIKETRDCMEEGSPKWFCRVEDLRKYADKLRGDHE